MRLEKERERARERVGGEYGGKYEGWEPVCREEAPEPHSTWKKKEDGSCLVAAIVVGYRSQFRRRAVITATLHGRYMQRYSRE
ncbi:uncharacterized protein LOC143214409 isoform X2 [Lasioglossum baleicum]|uniref:uncharacterized protein LOC143214409 isoform X2 n=1 Tax=Lasioglossum baleicum TaxID=434251 RepID=UPI003FCD50AE